MLLRITVPLARGAPLLTFIVKVASSEIPFTVTTGSSSPVLYENKESDAMFVILTLLPESTSSRVPEKLFIPVISPSM